MSEDTRLLCAVVGACGRPLGHPGHHGGFRTLAPQASPLRGEKVGHALTTREMETMILYARVIYLDEVAKRMGISIQTVKNNLTSVYRKLAVHSWPEAMYVMGWIRIPSDREIALVDFASRFEQIQTEIHELAEAARQVSDGLEAI